MIANNLDKLDKFYDTSVCALDCPPSHVINKESLVDFFHIQELDILLEVTLLQCIDHENLG